MLLDAADRLGEVFRAHSGELDEMRKLNEELRVAIQDTKHSTPTPPAFPFGVRRPLGGDGDDVVEESLIREIEADDEDDKLALRQAGTAAGTSSGRVLVSAASDALKKSTNVIGRISATSVARVALGRSNDSAPATPGSVTPPPLMSQSSPLTPSTSGHTPHVPSPGLAMSRETTLTFVEPPQRPRSTSHVSGLFNGKSRKTE